MKNQNFELKFCKCVIYLILISGNVLAIELGSYYIKISEIVGIFCLIYLFIKQGVFIRSNKITSGFIILLFIGFVAAFIANLKYNYSMSGIFEGLLYAARLIFYVVLASRIIYTFKKYDPTMQSIYRVIIFSSVVVSIIGFWQLIYYPSAHDYHNFLVSFGGYIDPIYDPHMNRLLSTYTDPNQLSLCLSVGLCLSVCKWIEAKSQEGNKYFIYTSIIAVAIILTSSRSGFLSIIIILFFIILLVGKKGIESKNTGYKSKTFLLILIAIVALTMLILTESRIITRIIYISTDGSALSRVINWGMSIELLKDNIIFGVGYNMLKAYTESIDSLVYYGGFDSSLINIFFTTGIAGFVFFIISTIKAIKNLLKYSQKNTYSICLIALIVSGVINCNFINILFYNLWLFPFLLIAYNIYELFRVDNNRKGVKLT